MKRKKIISWVLAAVFVAGALLLDAADSRFTAQLQDQTLAARWADDGSFSQVSCFFKSGSGFTEDSLVQLRYKLNEALLDAGVGAESTEEAEKGRTMVDAYSTVGTLTIASTRASTSTRAVGVGGDFFLFHPMTLLSGTYFDGDDLNSDGVILDEDIAWKLFGSYNVTGMEVTIGDCVYPVRGVVRRSTGAFSEAAGEDTPAIYVSYDILQGDGTEDTAQIDTYELLIRTPVTGFGVKSLTESLGISAENYETVENSSRFSMSHRLEIVKSFGARSMRIDELAYPYWENRARAYEDVSALLLVLEGLLLVYPAGWMLWVLAALYRRCRRVSIREIGTKLTDWAKGIRR